MGEITRQTFIDAFTHRDNPNPMPADELLRRLDITMGALKEQKTAKAAANCLCGALIRLSQAYGNAEVEAKIRELVAMATDITGI